jgi:hypothetical protein
MQEDLQDWTEVVLCVATNSMYTWVAVNSASAEKAASYQQRWGATAREAGDALNRDIDWQEVPLQAGTSDPN